MSPRESGKDRVLAIVASGRFEADKKIGGDVETIFRCLEARFPPVADPELIEDDEDAPMPTTRGMMGDAALYFLAHALMDLHFIAGSKRAGGE